MSVYHQLGHHSESMVLEPELNRFAGAILSPVNYSPTETLDQCNEFRDKLRDFDIVFDPQLYEPKTNRGRLQEWSYMPTDFDTSDQASIDWWSSIIDRVIEATKNFSPAAICSPAPYPRTFDDAYYDLLVMVGNELVKKLAGSATRPMLTALVGLDDLGRNDRHLQVGSILSKFSGTDIYLVLADDEPPRYERTDSGGLEGAARLIRLLVNAGYQITVGCTSSEMILWKAAGAQKIASGKYFNLRRFTFGRWDDDAEQGGRNISYWFEPSLLAFLREADLRRFMRGMPISASHGLNPYSQTILGKLQKPEREAWLADSWRQFLHWFMQCEAGIGNDINKVAQLLGEATATWKQVHDAKLRFEEERNDGTWVRAWDIVINELIQRPD